MKTSKNPTKSKIILTLAIFCAVLLLPKISQASTVFPVEDWQTASPESQGVDPLVLQQAISFVHDNSIGQKTREMMVIRSGHCLYRGEDVELGHKIYSAGKPLQNGRAGILVTEGKINVNDYAVKYYPALDDKYSEYANIKLKHLLTMTSGYNCGEYNLDMLPPLFVDGTKFQYSNCSIGLFEDIMTAYTGIPYVDYIVEYIASEIGMKYPATPGTRDISASSFAKYALLYLNRGNWNGKQIISSSYIDESSTNQVPLNINYEFDGRGRYGYYWWTNGIMKSGKRMWPSAPPKTYMAHGAGRNFCFIIPEWNMIIVRFDKNNLDLSNNPSYNESINETFWEEFFKILKTGIISTPPTDTTPPAAPSGLQVQ